MATHRGIVSGERPFNDQWFDVEVFSAHTHLFYVLRLECRLSLSIGEWVEWSESLYNQGLELYVVQENSPVDAYRAGVSSDFDAEVMQGCLVLTVHAMYCSDPSKESSNRKVLYSLEVGRVAVPPDADVTTLMKPDQPARVFVRKCTQQESYGTRFVIDRCQIKNSSLDEQAVRRMQHYSPSWASIRSEEQLSGAVSGMRVEEQPRFSPGDKETNHHTQQHSTFRAGNGGFGQRATGNSGFHSSRSASNGQQQGSEGSGQQPSKRGVFSGRGVTQSQSANNVGQQSGGSERRGGAFSGSGGGAFPNRGGFGGGQQPQEEPWGGAQEKLSKNQHNKVLREMCRDTYFALMLGGEWYRKMNPTGLRKGENAPFTIWTKDWGYSHCSVNYVSAEGENRNRTIQKGEWCKAYFKILKNNEQRVERIIDYIEPPFRTKYYEQHSCTVDLPSLNMMECSDACVDEHRFVDHLTLGAIAVPINDYNTYLNQSVWCKVELDQRPLTDTGVQNSPVAWWRAVEVRPEGAGDEEGGGGEGGHGEHKEGYEEEVTTVPPDFDSDDDERVTVIRNPAASNPVMFNGSYGPLGGSGGEMGGGKGKAASVHNTSGGSGGVGGASRFGGLGPVAGPTGAGFGQGASAASSKSESAMPATKKGYSTAAALRSHAPTPASQMFGGVGTGTGGGGGGRAASGRSSASGARMNILHSITREHINQQIDYQSPPLFDVDCIVVEKTTENSIVFTSYNKFCLLPGSSLGVGAWLRLVEARRLLVPLAGCVLVSTQSFDPLLPDPIATKVSQQKVQLELQLGEFGSPLEKTERGLIARTTDIGSIGSIVSVLIPWTVSNAHLLGGMDGSEWAGRFHADCNWRLWAHPRSDGRGGVEWEATEVIGMVNPPPAHHSGMDDIDMQKASHSGAGSSAFNAMSAVNKQRVADLNSPSAMGGAGMGGAFGQYASSQVSTSSTATGRSAFAEDLYQNAVDRSQLRGTTRRDQRLADYLTQLWRIPGVQAACKTEPNGGFDLFEKIDSEFK